MKTVPLPRVYGSSIFCDDLRQEVDGKFSLIGIYNGVMLVHTEFPAVLPKFAIAVTYFEKQGEVADDVSIQVFMPGSDDVTPQFRIDAPLSKLRPTSPVQLAPEYQSDEIVRRIDFPFVLSPLIIPQKGVIKVRAFVGDEIYKLGALRIEQQLPAVVPQSAEAKEGPTKDGKVVLE